MRDVGENKRNVGGRVGTGEITAISQAPAVLRLAGHFLQRAWTLLLLLDFAAYFSFNLKTLWDLGVQKLVFIYPCCLTDSLVFPL